MEAKTKLHFTDREILYDDRFENHLKYKINRQVNEDINKVLQEILDNRPRYSKRIPEKLYMKFHTLDVEHSDIMYENDID